MHSTNLGMRKMNKLFFFFECVYPFRIIQLLLFLHERLSFASLSAVPHVSSIFFKSPSKVFLRVIFGLQCFLLPGGFHLKPFLGILFCSILSTCPSHLCLLCLTSVAILQHSVLAYRSSFEILFGQCILQIRLIATKLRNYIRY